MAGRDNILLLPDIIRDRPETGTARRPDVSAKFFACLTVRQLGILKKLIPKIPDAGQTAGRPLVSWPVSWPCLLAGVSRRTVA
jgi:hypothetical protein